MNIEMLRADTPSCRSYVHANNAGASPSPEPVHQAVLRHLDLERRLGGYAAQEAAAQDLAAFYSQAAALIGAAPDEIAFTENATRAWDMAFYGMTFAPGDRILTHASEYVSNVLAMLQRARATGVEIDFASSDGSGQVDVAAMEAIRYARGLGLSQIEARITALADDLRQRLGKVRGVRLHDAGARRCGIVTFTRDGEVATETAARLRRAGVMVSVTPRAYARIDFEARGLDAVVRASLH